MAEKFKKGQRSPNELQMKGSQNGRRVKNPKTTVDIKGQGTCCASSAIRGTLRKVSSGELHFPHLSSKGTELPLETLYIPCCFSQWHLGKLKKSGS